MDERETPRRRLARLMTERRDELGLYWNDVAERAGLTKEGLRSVRGGAGTMRPPTKRGIEAALRWARGSVDRILEGGAPVALEEETAARAAVPPAPPAPPAGPAAGSPSAPRNAASGAEASGASGAGIDAGMLRSQLGALSEAGRRTGRTLGDMLVEGGYVSPLELALTPRRPDPVVEELEGDPDLPDEVKQRMLEGYRALRQEIAESLRKPD
ncbi:hypothetical protein Ppa06_61970 [Planomonospora parontospora subsp. parontospora]|uniref:Uncharacterized protein n=3 Tax=Planomonospora parontospora TaxID=58119 RepID=A0AA37BMJ7_9ACTN|nr:hypothetical protein [Planomonospora parontospora]GGK93780.1 hypothetical protein GCM10010126_61440 [Planomonospora parontospora]GII12399.1 hypothetical protein Ppa06_61970 [Planomonospora parontospora subsp. parontospora]